MKEKVLFEHLKENVLPDLERAEDEFSRWDCLSERHEMFIELKCRTAHYRTLLVEKKKWEALQEQAERLGFRPIYINSTPRGIYVFCLDEIPTPEWETRIMPASTQFERKDPIIKKTVGFINIADAKRVYAPIG